MEKEYEKAAKAYAEFISALKEIGKVDNTFQYEIKWKLVSSTKTEEQRELLAAEMAKY